MQGSFDIINDVLMVFLKIGILAFLSQAAVKYSRNSSARALHHFLFLTLLGCFLIPILSYTLPVIAVPVLPEFVGNSAQTGDLATMARRHPVIALLAIIYFAIAALQLARLTMDLRQLSLMRSNMIPVPLDTLPLGVAALLAENAGAQLLASPELKSPVSWGLLRPKLVLPHSYKSWDSARLRHVVLHELAHIQRRDWIVTVLARAITAVLWPVPGVCALRDRLFWYAEVACDDRVLCDGVSRTDYATSLLSFAEIEQKRSLGNYLIDPSMVFQRIHTVLDGARVYQSGSHSLFLGIIGLVCLLPISALELTPIPVQPTSSIVVFPLHSATLATPGANSPIDDPPELPVWPDLKKQLVFPESESPVLPKLEWTMDTKLQWQAATLRDPVWLPNPAPALNLTQHSVFRTSPVYPRRALVSGQEGEVVVEFEITPNGAVINEKIVAATPDGVFEAVTLDALRQFRFSPDFTKSGPETLQRRREIFRFELQEDATPNRSPANKVASYSRD